MFTCEAVATDLFGKRSSFDDFAYDKEPPTSEEEIRYMKLMLLEKYPPGKYPLKELKENGLTNVQGRSKATVRLMKYLSETRDSE